MMRLLRPKVVQEAFYECWTVRHDLAADLKAIRAGATVFRILIGVRTEYERMKWQGCGERAIKAEALAWELVLRCGG